MTLDVRANHAASAIRASVTGVTPLPLPGVVGRRRTGLAFGLALAAVIAFGSLALASVLTGHDLDTAATTIPGSPTVPAIVATGGGTGSESVTITQQNTASDSPEPYAKFSGTAPAGTTILASSPYGSADTVAGEGGTWSLTVPFTGAPPGETFAVAVTVGGTPYEFPFTCTWDPENVEITAFQSYGSSDAAEPYDVFYGSAPAGTPVVVTSDYGSADTTAGEHGEWELKVRFVAAPHREPFSIKVRVGDQTFAFGFIWLRGDGEITTTTVSEPVALSVHQWNTSSDSPEPYLKVYGTAPAGTHVLLQSEYGASDMVVEGGGEFYLKLWFSPLPPPGVQFPVTLKIDHEYFATYWFTSWFDSASTEVTVNQYNTETDSPDPYAKFYGTAPIGTHIVLQSEYGATDWNTESVNWTGKLFFSTLPPAGQTFTITVKIDGDVFGTYQFTSWYSPDQIAVTAHRSFGSCAESPPYDVYYGTAPPGTTVTITSAYSDTVAFTVGETGNWEKKVFFPESPIGTEIDVTVTVGGTAFHFGFTHLAA